MSIGETIQEHPKATAAVVVVGIIVLWLLFHGGSSAPVSASAPGTDVGAATGAYIAQQQSQAQTQQSNNALVAVQDQLGAQVTALTIQSQTQNHANDLQASLGMAKINADQQTAELITATQSHSTDLANTLSAQVQSAGIQAGVRQTEIQSATSLGTATIVANALVSQSNNQTRVNLESIAASHDIARANIDSSNAIQLGAQSVQLANIQQTAGVYQRQIAANENIQTQSWWDKLFG